MLSTNGHKKTAILYCRVSTTEQVQRGYSLAQQLEALREYASREGYEVLEEVTDPGQSGASLERPGMDRVRDLVASGGVSVVLAQDRDRFAREPAYLYLLREEFAEKGTKIRALNDHGDESPEGQLTDGILDQIARYERVKIAERSRRGKIAKAKEGKIIASRLPRYGFAHNEARDGYVIDEATMVYVRRIFASVALEGSSINAIKVAFDREGVPTPAGAPYWSHTAIRDIILDDCYKAHTFEEVKALCGGDGAPVLSRLERDKRYGIWYFGRRKTQTRQVSERAADGSVLYRKRQLVEGNPKSKWVAVPIVDPTVPREWVDAARAAISANNRPTPTSGGRQWPLSGGVFVCEGCGRSMSHMTTSRPNDKRYFYYRCPKRVIDGPDACTQKTYYKAEAVETGAWEGVRAILTDPATLRDDLEKMLEIKRKSEARGDPEREAKVWAAKLSEVERKRARFQDMAAEGLIDFEELRAKLAALEEQRESARRELDNLKAHREHIAQLEAERDALLEHYEQIAPEALDDLDDADRGYLYRKLHLKAIAKEDGSVELEMPGSSLGTIRVSKEGITW